MWYSRSSCTELFVCTAILCWDYNFLTITFSNLTRCASSSFHFNLNIHSILFKTNYSLIKKEYLTNGFICSNCSQGDFIQSRLSQCSKQRTTIEFRNYCRYKEKNNVCQCLPSEQRIQPIKHWVKAMVKHGKSHLNINRVNNINKTAAVSSYFLIGFISILVLFGGIVGMIFYWIKLKSNEKLQILK